ncbi:fimbrial protein [Citrobacter sp. FP75]|uniref:fimbrial protein n=1 Tax=Citrobacter sp. FP75 TaxID=1852949 RepID=UPI001BC98D5B|nr:fimbrial protein [Citrobacter sp. FP75]
MTLLKCFSSLFFTSLLVIGYPAQAVDNVTIDGTLVNLPCSLDPNSTNVPLDFGDLVSKYFYRNTRTLSREFKIVLIDCDLAIGQDVMVKFTGNQSVMPGLLAPDDGDIHGIAVGIELTDGTPVLLDKQTSAQPLTSGVTTLTFQGYVIGEPDAIKNQTIVTGPFIATTTFELIYP